MKDLIQIILSELGRFLDRFIGLFSGPKTYVQTLYENNDQSVVQSFTFAGISLVLHSVFNLSLLPKGKDIIEYTAIHATILLVWVLIDIGILRLSWRIVGGQGPFNKLLTILVYYSGAFFLITTALILLSMGVVKYQYPILYEPVKKVMTFGGRDALEELIDAARRMIEAGNLIGPVIVAGLFILQEVAYWIWFYIGWGAFRELNLASKRASAVAFMVYFVLSLASLPLVYFLAHAAFDINIKQ